MFMSTMSSLNISISMLMFMLMLTLQVRTGPYSHALVQFNFVTVACSVATSIFNALNFVAWLNGCSCLQADSTVTLK